MSNTSISNEGVPPGHPFLSLFLQRGPWPSFPPHPRHLAHSLTSNPTPFNENTAAVGNAYISIRTVRVAVGRVENKHPAVSPASLAPVALDVWDEKRQVALRQLGVQLALECLGVSAAIAVVAGALVLRDVIPTPGKVRL